PAPPPWPGRSRRAPPRSRESSSMADDPAALVERKARSAIAACEPRALAPLEHRDLGPERGVLGPERAQPLHRQRLEAADREHLVAVRVGGDPLREHL